ISGALTDEAVRNGSIKNVEKRGNIGEPNKDKNGRDDNKRTRTRNAFATTANPVGRENTGAWPKCTTYNSCHAPGGPCRTCFNYNRPSHFAKDCIVMPRNVNTVNLRNLEPARGACHECGSTDHLKPACPRLNRVQGPRGNRPNQVVANNGGQVIMEYLVTISKRRAFWSLNEDILKITIQKTNTPYPSRKIRHMAYPKLGYGVSKPAQENSRIFYSWSLHQAIPIRRIMDDPNITMEEYIRLQEEKAQRAGRTFNWQTATYGKVKYYEDEDDCFTNFESEFPAIVFDDTSDAALSCEPTVSPLDDNKINFRIPFDESDEKDYTVIYDENSFSYKTISINDLKTDSKNDNDKVNMPLFSTPEPEVGYSNNLDFFKDFVNGFPAIVYNDTLTSKSDFLTEPTESPQHIDEFNLKNEKSLSKCDEKEQNVLYFNDLFLFNVIYHDYLKSDMDNDIDEIDIEQSSGDMSVIPLPNVINTDDGAYALRSNKLLETMLAERQPGIYLSVIESVFPDCLYGVSKPHGYGVSTIWTLSRLYF
ncbi:hypothetical protein Tco_1280046, partial [Tanacetum coccineum]